MQAAGVEVIYPDTGPFRRKHAKFTLNSRNGHQVCTKHSTATAISINAQRPASSLLGGHALTGGFMRLFGKVAEFSVPLRYSFWLW